MNNKIKTEIAVGVVLILSVIIGGIFQIGNKKQTTAPAQTKKTQNESFAVPAQTKKTQNESSASNTNNISGVESPVIMQGDRRVIWYEQAKPIASPNLFKKVKKVKKDSEAKLLIKAWEVGKIENSNKSKVIFVTILDTDHLGSVVEGYVFVTNSNMVEGRTLQPYSRYSTANFLEKFDKETMSDIVITEDFNYNYEKIISLEYPGFIYFNNMVFQLEGDYIFDREDPFFYPEKFNIYKKIYSDKIYGDVFQNTENNGIYLKSPIGIAKVYSLKIDFFNGDIPQVSWNDGTKTQDPFTYRGIEGCGGEKYADDVSGQVSMDEIAPAGKTNTGEIIYEYKDKNAEYLKKLYQEDIDYIKSIGVIENPNFDENTPYDSFVSNHLVFFWKDPLGRLIRFINYNYVFGRGCGKPVIYLYPEKTTNVSVKITPTGGMTVSDPAYGQGWNVMADINSNLTNLADGKVYPYLFWEGRGNSIYQMPKNGFVTSRKNLENLLNDKLSQLGLIQKEIDDFKEFWLPRMLSENKPYYFVTFVSRKKIDELAPLEISPQPDTIIRVLMDYKGLDDYENVSELFIKTPERKGFTAVEWGGVLK